MKLNTLAIAGYPVTEASEDELVEYLLTFFREHKQATLLYANTNFVVKCRYLLNRLLEESVIIVNDGLGLDIAAYIERGKTFKANLNGTDFTPRLLSVCARPFRVYLFGAEPKVVSKAVRYVRHELKQVVVGFCDGYNDTITDQKLIEKINNSGAEILLVALGNPMQEQWILEHRAELHVALVSGVGALFDFWAGSKPRAPTLVQRMRLEWLYRLCIEPRRLIRRYTLDILVFFGACFKYHKS